MSPEATRRPVIFLIEEDDDTRPVLRQSLRQQGYKVRLAVDEEDALDRVAGGGTAADLVLVNLVGRTPEEALEVGRRVRTQARYDGQTPLVVMAERYGEDLAGRDVHMGGNDWDCYAADAEQLRALLRRLLP